METLQFTILPGEYSIHRFSPIKTVPKDIYKSDFLSIVFTDNELSLICNSSIDIESEKKMISGHVLNLLESVLSR